MNEYTTQHKQLLIPPKPSHNKPHVQLDWIWSRFLQSKKNPKTALTYKDTLNAYKNILRTKCSFDKRLDDDPRFYLDIHWDSLAVFRARMGWRDKGLKSITVHNHLSVLKQVIEFAARDGLTKGEKIIKPPKFPIKKETKINDAYSDAEIETIRKIVTKEINYSMEVARGYQRTGVGKDPRIISKTEKGQRLADDEGWDCWDNVIWFFENVLDCNSELVVWTQNKSYEVSEEGILFSKNAGIRHGTIGAVRRRLGISYSIGIEIISPLIVKLFLETGLNVGSIFNLRRDCFQLSHEQTGLPYLKYRKERSKGEMELHLALLDNAETTEKTKITDINEENVIHLMPRQSDIVRRTIETLQKLTEPLIASAENEDKDFLLLYETTVKNGRTRKSDTRKMVKRANQENVTNWLKQRLRKLEKEGENIDVGCFNLSRFRATKITQMTRDGHDFFQVQAVAGHASVITTVQYLDDHQISPHLQRDIRKALIQIHNNRNEYENLQLPYAQKVLDDESRVNSEQKVIYKGIISDCKDIYDPPKNVAALPDYKSGQACGYWNMCLFCKNIIITRKHLPLIVRYTNDILTAFRDGSLSRLPNVAHYRRTLKVLSKFLMEISPEHLAWAKREADCQDMILDPVIFRGVQK